MYNLIVDKKVEKYIGTLDSLTRKRVLKAFLALAENPYKCPNVKRLKGTDKFRQRVGDYRIIFKIVDAELIVEVLKVGPRRNVYDDL